MQIPVGSEAALKGVVDLVKNKAILWKDEKLGAEFEVVEIPSDLKEQAEKYRKELDLVTKKLLEVETLDGDTFTEVMKMPKAKKQLKKS